MHVLLLSLFLTLNSGNPQSATKISTLDFVQVLNDKHQETLFYYENNWLPLRKEAVNLGYIESYALIKVEYSEETPYHLILQTTYGNQKQFDNREENFGKLIAQRGERKLLNDLQPGDFRTFAGGVPAGIHLH